MVTYKQIQEYVKENYGVSIKTCWIAHMKEMCGLPRRTAPNRIDKNSRVYPCPVDKKEMILKAFKHFGMID